MKKLLFILTIPFFSFSQIGVKVGLNHSTSTNFSQYSGASAPNGISNFKSNFNPGVVAGITYRGNIKNNSSLRTSLSFYQSGYNIDYTLLSFIDVNQSLMVSYLDLSFDFEFFIENELSVLVGMGQGTPIDNSDSAPLLNGRLGISYTMNDKILIEFITHTSLMTGFPSDYIFIKKGPIVFQFGVGYFIAKMKSHSTNDEDYVPYSRRVFE